MPCVKWHLNNMDIKNFAIFKLPLEEGKTYTEKDPSHQIAIKDGEKWRTIGRCWTRDGKSGKFLSCLLSKPYKNYSGYSIVEEKPEPTIDPVTGIDCNNIGF